MKRVLLLFVFSLLFMPFFILSTDKVEINTASLEQLDQIIGIGPVLGQRIIDERPFSSVDDLIRVKGIGEKTLQKIKDQGLAYVGEKSEIQNSKSETNSNTQNSNIQNSTTPPPPRNEQTNENLSENTSSSINPPPDAQNAPPATPNSVLNITYPEGIFINEILPNSEGADEENEWIELYNSNDFEVNLSKWRVNDIAGNVTTYTFAENTKVPANGFLLLKRTDTKITLNNDWDGLNLSAPNKKIMDSATYSSAPKNQSYNRTGSGLPVQAGWQWSATLTPGAVNIINTAVKSLPESKKSVKNNIVEAGAASLNQTTNLVREPLASNGASPWFLFFTALVITIISAVFVLIIKLKFFKKDVRT